MPDSGWDESFRDIVRGMDRTYRVTLPATVTVHPDGTIELVVDAQNLDTKIDRDMASHHDQKLIDEDMTIVRETLDSDFFNQYINAKITRPEG